MTDVFALAPPALAACRAVLDPLEPGETALATPCPELTVGQVVEHLHLAMIRIAGLAGATLPADAALPDLVAGALEAWRERGLEGEVELRGPLAAHRAAELIPLELVVHSWDIAAATGRPITVPDDLALALLSAARDIVPTRRGKAFGPEVAASADAPPLRRLLALTGRTVPT